MTFPRARLFSRQDNESDPVKSLSHQHGWPLEWVFSTGTDSQDEVPIVYNEPSLDGAFLGVEISAEQGMERPWLHLRRLDGQRVRVGVTNDDLFRLDQKLDAHCAIGQWLHLEQHVVVSGGKIGTRFSRMPVPTSVLEQAVIDVCAGDLRAGDQLRQGSSWIEIDEVRHVRDGQVHLDTNDWTAVRILPVAQAVQILPGSQDEASATDVSARENNACQRVSGMAPD